MQRPARRARRKKGTEEDPEMNPDRKKQIEEAKTKFYEGYKLFEKESSIIYNEFFSIKK